MTRIKIIVIPIWVAVSVLAILCSCPAALLLPVLLICLVTFGGDK
jgi:hypothetical protein